MTALPVNKQINQLIGEIKDLRLEINNMLKCIQAMKAQLADKQKELDKIKSGNLM